MKQSLHGAPRLPVAGRRAASGRRKELPGARHPDDETALFFERSPDMLCIAGLDGYFRRLNQAWTARLGWTLPQLRLRPFLEFVHPDDREATRSRMQGLARGVDTILYENRYLRRDGSYIWLQWNARPIPGRVAFYATARDVTRRKQLEKEILGIVDRERERLGREIHDGLCQTLAGIAALASTLARGLKNDSRQGAAELALEIAALLQDSITQARDLARGLDPARLRRIGLDKALEALARDTQHRFDVSCTASCDRPPGLRQEVKMHLIRIAQEAVNNAVSHGQASRIDLALGCESGMARISIRDDGVGVPERLGARSGLGLSTMAHRASLIGGTLDVRRAPGHGTLVTCLFPAPPRAAAVRRHDHERKNR
jgi:PAS domain S-box-containing protein